MGSGDKKDFNGITIEVSGEAIGRLKEWAPEYQNKNRDNFSDAIVPTDYKPPPLVEMKADAQIAEWWEKEIEAFRIPVPTENVLLRTSDVKLANRVVTDQLALCGLSFDAGGTVEIPGELAGEILGLMLDTGYQIVGERGGEWEGETEDVKVTENFQFNYVSVSNEDDV